MYDRSKLKDGYVFIMENAKNHFQSAEILAEQGFYGLANSHLILSSEEAVKAYIIFAQHYDHDLKIENFEKIFSDHKHKHKLIKEMTFSFAFIEKIMNFFVEPAKALMENDKKNFTKNELMNARNTGLKNLKSWLKKRLM
jgi:AbiV family abortive infection protein